MKRSRALRGRNPARDNQVDGAPRVHQAPDGESHRGPFLDAIGHRSHASQNPPKFLRRREARKPLKPRGFEAIRHVFYPLDREKSPCCARCGRVRSFRVALRGSLCHERCVSARRLVRGPGVSGWILADSGMSRASVDLWTGTAWPAARASFTIRRASAMMASRWAWSRKLSA